MKKILQLAVKTFSSLLFCIILSFPIVAQSTCGSETDFDWMRINDPERFQLIQQMDQHVVNYKQYMQSPGPAGGLINQNGTILIPVVVHVLHRAGEVVGTGLNISDAQILSQIDALNEDFRRLNADRVNTPSPFQSVAADFNIQFRLACVDPNGNSTNGIHRIVAGKDPFFVSVSNNLIDETAAGIKYNSQGGTDAWPTNTYLIQVAS